MYSASTCSRVPACCVQGAGASAGTLDTALKELSSLRGGSTLLPSIKGQCVEVSFKSGSTVQVI